MTLSTNQPSNNDSENEAQEQEIEELGKKWYEQPFGVFLIAVSVIVFGGFVLFFFGWR
jgi:hypothetical protein